MTLREISYTTVDSRLRAGWRLALQTLLLLSLGLCVGVPIVILIVILDPSILSNIFQLRPEHLLLATIGETIVITTSVFLARRFLDKQSIESLGLKLDRQALYDVLVGIGIAALQMTLIYFLMLGLGWLPFEGFALEFDPLSIGLHIACNFFEGVVFGFPVSGLDFYALTRITVHGPEIWTGGAFGPEAGLIVLPGLLLGALLIYLYTQGRQI